MAFGIHTKTAEPIEMPFGLIGGLGPRNSVLRGDDDPRRGRGSFGETCPISLTPLWIANRIGLCSGVQLHTIGADAWLHHCKRWTSLLLPRRGMGLHSAGEVWYLRLPCHFCKKVGISVWNRHVVQFLRHLPNCSGRNRGRLQRRSVKYTIARLYLPTPTSVAEIRFSAEFVFVFSTLYLKNRYS